MNPKRSYALRAAIVATGLVGSVALSGCEKLQRRIVDGTGTNGDPCVGWSMKGSPEACCAEIGGYYNGRMCINLAVPGPFVPPSMES